MIKDFISTTKQQCLRLLAMLVVLNSSLFVSGQATGFYGAVFTLTTYSANGCFYLKSVPHDDRFPSLRGKTSIYKIDLEEPLYTIQRKFDSLNRYANDLTLSNNGEVIIFFNSNPVENIDELRSITIYKNGKLINSFTKSEITGIDDTKERSSLIY